jgi:hypothetical protein
VPTPTPDPRYTDEQMALILKRAAESQSVGEEQVHTLAEIQQIAQQVGIEPRLIAAAAAGLPTRRQGRANDGILFGAPSSYRLTRRLPGSPVAARRAELIATIRDHMAQVGSVSEFDDRIEWYAGPADNKSAVTIEPSESETVIRVDMRQHGPKVGLYLLAGTVTLVATVVGTIASPVVGMAIGAGTLVSTFTGARTWWGRIAARRERRVGALMEALTNEVQNGSSASPEA